MWVAIATLVCREKFQQKTSAWQWKYKYFLHILEWETTLINSQTSPQWTPLGLRKVTLVGMWPLHMGGRGGRGVGVVGVVGVVGWSCVTFYYITWGFVYSIHQSLITGHYGEVILVVWDIFWWLLPLWRGGCCSEVKIRENVWTIHWDKRKWLS